MNRSGIVMDVKNNKVCLMTGGGEFISVKCRDLKPEVGQIYEGEQISKVPFYKYSLTAASIILLMFFGNLAYAYNTPVASILVRINPNVELKINRWEKIIKTIPLNKDGKSVLSALKLRNKSLQQGLNLIVDEAKKENFINQDYINSGKEITISIKDIRGNRIVDISKFMNNAAKKKLKVRVIFKDNNDVKSKDEDKILKSIKKPENYKKVKTDQLRQNRNNKEEKNNLIRNINNFSNKKTESRGSENQNYWDNGNNKSYDTNKNRKYNEGEYDGKELPEKKHEHNKHDSRDNIHDD